MDNDELNKRRWMLSQNMQIEHSQMPLDTYLERLTKDERNNILRLLSDYGSFQEKYFRSHPLYFSVLGVGTTTYSRDYWEELSEYLKKNDPEKLRYIENNGEDIDLLLCPSLGTDKAWGKLYANEKNKEEFFNKYKQAFQSQKNPTDKDMYYLIHRLKEKESYKRNYPRKKFPEFYDGKNYDVFTRLSGVCCENKIRFSPPKAEDTNFGTGYYTVPEEEKKNHNENVVRVKGKQFDKTMKIKYEGCRPFHIYVRDNLSFDERIAEEKIQNIPFTVIYSPGSSNELEDLIREKNREPKIDRTPVQPKQWKRGDEIRF